MEQLHPVSNTELLVDIVYVVLHSLAGNEKRVCDRLRAPPIQEEPDDLTLPGGYFEGGHEIIGQGVLFSVGGTVEITKSERNGKAVKNEEIEGLRQALKKMKHGQERGIGENGVDQHEWEKEKGEGEEHGERPSQDKVADGAKLHRDKDETVDDHPE